MVPTIAIAIAWAALAMSGDSASAPLQPDDHTAPQQTASASEPNRQALGGIEPLHTVINVVAQQDAVNSETVATSREIEPTGARTVLDAVTSLVPGAFVTRRGIMGYGIATNGTGGISIRGVGGSPNTNVLVIVDGRPDYQGLMGHPLPDFYSLSDAASVSVTEGPASVLYGSNAMGGVVEVKPAEPRGGMSTRLTTSFGSFNTGQHRLAHGARFDRFFYSLNAGLSHTSGDRPRSAFRDQDGTASAGYDISETWKASLHGRYGHFYVEDPGPVTAPLPGSYATVGRGGFSFNLDNTAGRKWGYARIYSSYGHHFITDGFRSNDRTTGVRVEESFAVAPDVVFQAGTDVVNYGGKALNVTAPLDYGSHGATSGAGFARAQWAPAGALRTHAGVRYENNSIFGGITVPEAGATVAFGRYSVTAEIGKGFRNPTIRELYLFPAPNPLLQPERMWNYQASFQAHPASALSLAATFFYADLSNLIAVTGRYPNLALANTGRALNRGIESSLRWRPVRRVALYSGYAWLHSTNLAPYVPAHKLDWSVQYDAGRFFVHAGATTIGTRWVDAAHKRNMSGYTNATARITVPTGRHASFFVLVDNLLNRRYQVVEGYPMPGVNAAGGVAVNF